MECVGLVSLRRQHGARKQAHRQFHKLGGGGWGLPLKRGCLRAQKVFHGLRDPFPLGRPGLFVSRIRPILQLHAVHI